MGDDFIEDAAQLQPGQVGAQAEVLADAEGPVLVVDILPPGPGDVEDIGVFNVGLVGGGGLVEQHYLLALAELLAAPLLPLAGRAAEMNDRSVVRSEERRGGKDRRDRW